MTFISPFFAWAALGVALATVGLHLLAWRRPPESPLPTARFAPERPIRMVSRAVKPTDLGLLALRVLLIALVGLALAGPVLTPNREGSARVVVVDRSQSVGNGDAVTAAARGVFRSGDALVVFDSAAYEVSTPTVDSVRSAPTRVRGALSAALIVATRAANRLAREHDTVTIVVVSPFTTDALDGATEGIRRTWAGPVQVIRAGGAPNDSSPAARPQIRAGSGDPVSVALGLVGAVASGDRVRVVRDAIGAADSAWARQGNVLVAWPGAVPAEWARRQAIDTAFGVSTVGPNSTTMVSAFERAAVTPTGRVVARWSDGESAATETALGSGCIRAVGVSVPAAGDLALTPAFRRFAERLVAPCGGGMGLPVSDSALALALPASVTAQPAGNQATISTGSTTAPRRSLVAWLLGAAIAAAIAEMFVRRGGSHATA